MTDKIFTKEDLEACNTWVTEKHWCRDDTKIIIQGSDISAYDIHDLENPVILSNGYLSFFAAGIGWAPETVVVNPEKEITKDQWIELGYEDYKLDLIMNL